MSFIVPVITFVLGAVVMYLYYKPINAKYEAAEAKVTKLETEAKLFFKKL